MMLPLYILLPIFAFLQSVQANVEDAVKFEIVEELPPDSLVGNIIKSGRIKEKYPKEVIRRLEFEYLTRPPIPISIGRFDGIIRTTGVIDRDTIPSCRLKASCEIGVDVVVQPVSYFKIIKVLIVIKDINDNAPKFSENSRTISILETSSIESSFLLPSATDIDSPAFGVKRYELKSNVDIFELGYTQKLEGLMDARLGLRGRLDRELVDRYDLVLTAFDGGKPPKSSSVNVTVKILDFNDNDPVFEKSSYDVTVKETIPVNTIIVTVKATDKDIEKNGEVSYSFSSQTRATYGHIFSIHPINGSIIVTGKLDREAAAICQLIVTAMDSGPNAHPVTVTVRVVVEDVNDNAPEISVHTLPGTTTGVAENSKPGTFVAYIIAKDRDLGVNGIVNCSLGGDGERMFTLKQRRADVTTILQMDHHRTAPSSSEKQFSEEVEYQLLTSVSHDRELHSKFNLLIFCSDAGTPKLTSTLSVGVEILDQNDNTPKFSSELYTASILENNPTGASIVRVVATDADAEENGKIRYIISGQAAGTWFDITEGGVILARLPFDREERGDLEFDVLAVDRGVVPKTGSCHVIVNIRDDNDERPIFKSLSYSFDVQENEPAGSFVGVVAAVDRDLEPYNQFIYSFLHKNSATDNFVINPKNGSIHLKRELDREHEPEYNLVVNATELDWIEKYSDPIFDRFMTSSTANIIIRVIDINDNAPKFQFPSPINNTIHISNKVPVGATAATLVAFDIDTDENAKIVYDMFIPEETMLGDDEHFRIDSETGMVTVLQSLLEMDDGVKFTFKVRASDKGIPPQSTEGTFRIIINSTMPYHDASVWINTPKISDATTMLGIAAGTIFVLVFLIMATLFCLATRKRRENCRSECKYIEARYDGMDVYESGGGIKRRESEREARENDLSNENLLTKEDKEDWGIWTKRDAGYEFGADRSHFADQENYADSRIESLTACNYDVFPAPRYVHSEVRDQLSGMDLQNTPSQYDSHVFQKQINGLDDGNQENYEGGYGNRQRYLELNDNRQQQLLQKQQQQQRQQEQTRQQQDGGNLQSFRRRPQQQNTLDEILNSNFDNRSDPSAVQGSSSNQEILLSARVEDMNNLKKTFNSDVVNMYDATSFRPGSSYQGQNRQEKDTDYRVLQAVSDDGTNFPNQFPYYSDQYQQNQVILSQAANSHSNPQPYNQYSVKQQNIYETRAGLDSLGTIPEFASCSGENMDREHKPADYLIIPQPTRVVGFGTDSTARQAAPEIDTESNFSTFHADTMLREYEKSPGGKSAPSSLKKRNKNREICDDDDENDGCCHGNGYYGNSSEVIYSKPKLNYSYESYGEI